MRQAICDTKDEINGTRNGSSVSLVRSRLSLHAGFTLIEIIVGVAILLGIFISIGGVAQYALRMSSDANLRIRSAFLAAEGIEAAKIMRDRGWTQFIASLTPDTEYYLLFSTDRWIATTTPAMIDGVFSRTMKIENVFRNASDDIVESGGVADPNTKKVTVAVRWTHHGIQRQDVIATYLTNLFEN